MTKEDLKRVQEINFEILCVIDELCDKYNIEYFLFYGTLLGAIRHQGPIPWDYDVDIAMNRENYLRFYEIAKKELDSSKYRCKVMGSGSLDYVSELKVGKIDTLFCMPGTENIDIMNNVQVDVFCMDYLRSCSVNQYKFRRKLWGVLKLIKLNWSEKQLLFICIDRSRKRFKAIYKIALCFFHIIRSLIGEKQLEYVGYRMFVDKNKKSGKMLAISSLSGNIYNDSWLVPIKAGLYNGRMMCIPTDYAEVLKTDYNNYMELPPENKRYWNHFEEWIFKENLI